MRLKQAKKGQFFILAAVILCSCIFVMWSTTAQLRRTTHLGSSQIPLNLLLNIKNEAKRAVEISLAEYSQTGFDNLSKNLDDWVSTMGAYCRRHGYEFHGTYQKRDFKISEGQSSSSASAEVFFTVNFTSPSTKVYDSFTVNVSLNVKVTGGSLGGSSSVTISVQRDGGVPIAGCDVAATGSAVTPTITDNGDGTYTVSVGTGTVRSITVTDHRDITVDLE